MGSIRSPTALCSIGFALAALLISSATLPAQTAADGYLSARTLGSASAPVTVYEMSDFQCPWCRKHAVEVFPELQKLYIATGKARWVFINFPLTQLHPNAAAAAEFAMCSAKAGKFWPVHDLLFKYQDKWAPLKDPAPFLLTLADSVGVARPDILGCLSSGEMRPIVQADAEGAARSGAQSTPSFYLEGGIMAGAQPVAVFTQILDSIYAEKVKR
jgi:protein-disulfide isomerase